MRHQFVIAVLSFLCWQQVKSQRNMMRQKAVAMPKSSAAPPRELKGNPNDGLSKMDNDEFLRRAETFFKNATRMVGMTKKGSDAAWKILVKYSAAEQVDPTRKISPQEEKRRKEQIEQMRVEMRKTLSESDRKKLAELERNLKMEINKKVKARS